MSRLSMTFGLLGPLEVRAGSAPVQIAAHKQRTVLAMLLVHAGRKVTMPALTTEVWGANPPPSAVLNLRSYVMQLRRQLAPVGDRLRTSRAGYLLRVAEDELDLLLFQSECTRGRKAASSGDLLAAEQVLGDALALWRGPAVEDVTAGPKLRAAAEQLTEQRLVAAEDHADVQLALGRHAAVVHGFRGLVEQYPLRERVYSRLMLALYQSGDVAGALDVFARARGVLAERLHLAPGPDLVRCQQAILRRDPGLALVSPPVRGRSRTPRPRQLTKPPSIFVDRTEEAATVEHVLRTSGPRPGVVLVHGLAGTGKSAFVLRAAHTLAGHFPDGQLYADLQGTSQYLAPLEPAEVLQRFLRALGVPQNSLPVNLAGAQALFRSLLVGRRVLIVLDDVANTAQAAPLLPTDQGSAALVTSRATLPALEATTIALDVLGEADSLRLLSFTAGRERVMAEPDAAADITRWCGRHPLALRIAGARLAARPDWSLARFEERLRPPSRRLDELRLDDLSVRSRFATSYRLLDSVAAQAFRRLGALDAPEFDAGTAAAQLAAEPALTQDLLGELSATGLLTQVTAGRFRMHSLSRLYAIELAGAEHRPPL